MKTLDVTKTIHRSPLRRGFLRIPLVLAWFALFPSAWAADGGRPNQNTAEGTGALSSLTSGTDNTAVGFDALYSITDGSEDTATGSLALANDTAGLNTAFGFSALTANTTGQRNVAIGRNALLSNTTGHGNIALGFRAGINLTTGSRNIDIGNEGVAGEFGKIRIGTEGAQKNAFIAGISGRTVPGGVAVVIGPDGHLGTVTSSARFKDEIKPMDKASEAIFGLKPVTFHYKSELDPNSIPQFGLVAEQVEKVNPGLVARDEEGKPYTVRYEAVNAMLLNEFLKQHRTVQEQKATIAQLKKDFAEQQKQIEALTTGLQKVSVQFELSKPAPQTVVGN